ITKLNESNRTWALEALAVLDPGRVLELLDKGVEKHPWFQDYLRRAVVKALLVDSPDEARTVVEAMLDPGWRSTGYLDLWDAVPLAQRPQKRELLTEALLQARNMKDASHRVLHLGTIGKHLHALGEKDQAQKLLREGEALARQLPTAAFAGYARGAFATELAPFDLPAALALLKDLKDPWESDRYHGSIAHKLAGLKPAEAERVLELLSKRGQKLGVGGGAGTSCARAQYGVQVCYRMAPVDLERARRLADGIGDPHYQARAYGVMALALAKAQPARAVELLDRAFAVLQAHRDSGKDR